MILTDVAAVDLISYEVTGLGPLELKELVPGTGKFVNTLPYSC